MSSRITFDDYNIQNDYIEDMINNPQNYDANEIYNYGYLFRVYRKSLFDSLLIICAQKGYTQNFVNVLTEDGLYDEYIEEVEKSNNTFMKIYVSLFLENDNINKWFKDEIEIVNLLTNTKDYNASNVITALSKLSSLDIDDSTLELMKNNTKEFIKNNNDLKNSLEDDQINMLIEECINNFESNHNIVKQSLSLK